MLQIWAQYGVLDFDPFEGSKNTIFHNPSRRPQMVRFVLVTLRAA